MRRHTTTQHGSSQESTPSTAGASYDTIGHGYHEFRRPDPHIASAIRTALRDASSVVNVGAGTGSYEPDDRELIAVEPSTVMIAQRPAGAAPAIQAAAEALPLPDQAVEAAMAVLTLQHWEDVEQGLSEMLRVASRRIVLATMDVEVLAELWVVRDYLPETLNAHVAGFPSIARLLELLPGAAVAAIPVPRECTDGFMAAFWGRPEAYLDARVRAATSPWHQLPPAAVTRALDRLRRDLADGWWDRRYGHLRQQAELDVGLRLVSLEASATRGPGVQHPLDDVQARWCIRADRAAAFAFFGAMDGTVIQVAGQAPHDELLPARAVAGALGLGPDVVPRCD